MPHKILCSGHLVRHPLGGHTWHHLQYLVGFQRMGHEVVFFEDHGWAGSCYDAGRDEVGDDPSFGVSYIRDVFGKVGFTGQWCYLAADGQVHGSGISRADLAQFCRGCDVHFNLSNINWIDELKLCRRRALIDTDPVFTQIGGHGAGGPLEDYHVRFTYGENAYKPGCEMPTGGLEWLPTRQPVVLDLWPVTPGNAAAPLTTLINWTAYGEQRHKGRVYGQKDREFVPFFSLPRDSGAAMEIALNGPKDVKDRFREGGWRHADPLAISRDPWTYQRYLAQSRGEFCVAKHGYVSTRCGWFSDRSSAYLALGRPVVLQDTGYSDFLPTGRGLLAYRTPAEALAAVRSLAEDYETHCRAARRVAEECFDSRRVLNDLLERSL